MNKILGDLVFDNPLLINGNFTVLKNLNRVDFPQWLSTSINTNTLQKQVMTGNLVVHGDVTVKRNVTGSGSINGMSIQKLASDIQTEKSRLESLALNKMVKIKDCIYLGSNINAFKILGGAKKQVLKVEKTQGNCRKHAVQI